MKDYDVIIMGAGRSTFAYSISKKKKNIFERYLSNDYYHNTENSKCSLRIIQLIRKTYTLALKDRLIQIESNKLFSIECTILSY